MATNFYFNNFPTNQITEEQLLVEDLVIESMQIHGMDVYYLPRTSRDPGGPDLIYGEDTLKQYVSAVPIEIYLENVTGMEGDQDFISKFGLEIRDEIKILVSRRRFKYAMGGSNYSVPRLGDLVASESDAPTRPREGDLIFIPLLRGFFEVTFVEHENDQAMYYTLGRGRGGNVYVYAVSLKMFVMSDEIINTGRAEIDEQVFDYYRRTRLNLTTTGSGKFVPGEIVYQGTDLANATAQAIIHTHSLGKYIDVIQVNGLFANGQIARGVTSNANFITLTPDDMIGFNNTFEDATDNYRIEQEGEGIIDFTENNPFGEP